MSSHPRRPARALLAPPLMLTLTLGLALPPPLWGQVPAPATPPGGAAAAPGHSPALRSRTPVTVNFVNADIEAVTRAFAAMIQRQISVDPRVKGTITVYSEQPLSIREAYLTYQSALRGLGFAVVETGGLLKVVPEADAKLQAGTVAVGAVPLRGDQVITQIFTLRHENPNNLVTVLRPLISANNTINASPGSNSLVITDYADNLQRIALMIAALDQPSQTDFEVVPLKHALASDLAPVLQRMADSGVGAAAPPGMPGGGSSSASVAAHPPSNSLFIRAPNAARHAALKAAIEKLDRPQAGGGPAGNLWVVYLKNADATRLATVLRAAFPATGSGGSGGGGGPSAAAVPVPSGQPGGTGAASAQATAPITAAAAPSTGGFVQADPATNSLIITAAEPLYRQVRALIDQLDTRRAQVYIESMIVEVSGDNAADFGFQWQGILGNRGDSNLLAAGTNFGTGGSNIISLQTGAASGTVSLPQGLNIGLIRNFGGTYALAGIARALQSQTATNIISTPNQITLDNEEAKIVVGSNVPFITGQYTGGSGGSSASNLNPFQTIERKDVGLTLRVRPQVGEGGTVRMSIFLESSSVSEKVAPGTSNAGPSTNKRQIESNVVVDDGGIIVLGGLIEDRFTESRSKVPLLGDLPYVGGLFRSESRTKTRTNLMVFLRPVVLRDAASGDRLSLDRYDLIRAQQQASQPAPNPMLPLGEGPVLPPLSSPAPGSAPGSAPAPARAPGAGTPPAPAGTPATEAPAGPGTPAQPAPAGTRP